MDRIQASLERLQALWHQLARAKPDSPEYNAIAKQIRAESDAYTRSLRLWLRRNRQTETVRPRDRSASPDRAERRSSTGRTLQRCGGGRLECPQLREGGLA